MDTPKEPSMRTLPFLIAAVALVGTPFELQTDGWQIRTVQIDNPTQAWLYIDSLSRYIAPRTLGTLLSVDPARQRITGHFVAAPPGGVPSVFSVADPPVTGQMYEENLAETSPLDYGLIPAILALDVDILALGVKIDLTNTRLTTLNASIAALGVKIDATNTALGTLDTDILALITALQNLKGGWGATPPLTWSFFEINQNGGGQTIVVGAGDRFAYVQCTASWNPSGGPYVDQLLVVGEYVTSGDVAFWGTLTVQNPVVNFPVPPGSMIGAAGDDFIVKVTAIGGASAANDFVDFTLAYYLD